MTKRPLFFPRSARSWLALSAAYVVGIGIATASVTYIGHRVMVAAVEHAPVSVAESPAEPVDVIADSKVLEAEGEWMQSVRSGRMFRNSKKYVSAPPSQPPSGVGIFDVFKGGDVDPEELAQSGTFKTVCVRTCDGYAFPVSFATTPNNFARDEQKCQRSCTSPAKLYVQRTQAAASPVATEMYDLRGRPYSALPTANLYQTNYDESCKCRAHSWEAEAQERHKVYALEAASRKGDKKARAELNDVRAAQAALRKQASANSVTSEQPRQRRSKRRAVEDDD